jgi:hypothetical protein
MANKLPPLPVGVAPGSGYWNDWYEKLRTLINNFADGFLWSSITGTPTTLSGYGITDAQKAIAVQDEGSTLGTVGTVDTLNFTGAGVTASRVGNTVSVTIGGGGGGGGNSVLASVDFGASFTDKAFVTVTEPWVTATSNIVVHVLPSADPDEMYLLDIKPVVSNRTAGTFDLTLYSEPEARGTYEVMCIGV